MSTQCVRNPASRAYLTFLITEASETGFLGGSRRMPVCECYRNLPKESPDALLAHLHGIMLGSVLPPIQVLTFIPKADSGNFADNFRPVDMPDTVARIIDSAVFAAMMKDIAPVLHQSQALVRALKEGSVNFLTVQDGARQLTDMAKAFERVNPGWLLETLLYLRVPIWVTQYGTHPLYGRRSPDRIQGFLLQPTDGACLL